MKKLLAFAMVLSLGLFCAVGCNKPAPKTEPPKPAPNETDKAAPPKDETAKPDEKAPDAAAAPASEEKKE